MKKSVKGETVLRREYQEAWERTKWRLKGVERLPYSLKTPMPCSLVGALKGDPVTVATLTRKLAT